MFGEDDERWKELCAQAAIEQDPEKLTRLTTEIIELLEAKQRKLEAQRKPRGEWF